MLVREHISVGEYAKERFGLIQMAIAASSLPLTALLLRQSIRSEPGAATNTVLFAVALYLLVLAVNEIYSLLKDPLDENGNLSLPIKITPADAEAHLLPEAQLRHTEQWHPANKPLEGIPRSALLTARLTVDSETGEVGFFWPDRIGEVWILHGVETIAVRATQHGWTSSVRVTTTTDGNMFTTFGRMRRKSIASPKRSKQAA